MSESEKLNELLQGTSCCANVYSREPMARGIDVYLNWQGDPISLRAVRNELAARESELAEAKVANQRVVKERDDWQRVAMQSEAPRALDGLLREELAEAHRRVAELESKLAQSTNYVADDEIYPHVVWFANGRTVSIASGGHLDIGMGGRLAAAKGDASDEP